MDTKCSYCKGPILSDSSATLITGVGRYHETCTPVRRAINDLVTKETRDKLPSLTTDDVLDIRSELKGYKP